MKDLQFRVWDKMSHSYRPNNEIAITGDGAVCDITECLWSEEKDEHFIVQWSSGITDKNGKMIFDGDIIEMTSKPDEHGDVERYREEVIFENGAFGDKYDYFCNYLFLPSFSIKVIGNIHQNPELCIKKA